LNQFQREDYNFSNLYADIENFESLLKFTLIEADEIKTPRLLKLYDDLMKNASHYEKL
jgi:hypothetical protein